MFPIEIALKNFGHALAKKSIHFRSENTVVSFSRYTSFVCLVRRLVLASLKQSIFYQAEHIPGKINTLQALLTLYQVYKVCVSTVHGLMSYNCTKNNTYMFE